MLEKTWSKEEIVAMLERNPKAVLRAIMAIFNKQVEVEKANKQTLFKNFKGYNHPDARFMTNIALKLQIGQKLSEEEFAKAKARIFKYSGQLTKIANHQI